MLSLRPNCKQGELSISGLLSGARYREQLGKEAAAVFPGEGRCCFILEIALAAQRKGHCTWPLTAATGRAIYHRVAGQPGLGSAAVAFPNAKQLQRCIVNSPQTGHSWQRQLCITAASTSPPALLQFSADHLRQGVQSWECPYEKVGSLSSWGAWQCAHRCDPSLLPLRHALVEELLEAPSLQSHVPRCQPEDDPWTSGQILRAVARSHLPVAVVRLQDARPCWEQTLGILHFWGKGSTS